MRFDIQPYMGALPITFGMRREEVHRLLGSPWKSDRIWNGSGVTDHYDKARFNVAFDNDGEVMHVGFSPGEVELTIQGLAIWTLKQQTDPNPVLLNLDPEPFEKVGIWFYKRIGVTCTGYHDDDPSQWAITVFPRGRKDEFLQDAMPADTRKYLPQL